MNVDGLNYCALAHKIVEQTRCPSCEAPKGVRCLTRAWRRLAPSASHRPRIDLYWQEREDE